jgi:predicted RNase H-like HicB family nuclease
MHYEIRVEWDAEAGVWYIEDSNVPGLVGEAATLEAMMALLQVRVPEMLEENGCPRDDDIPLRLLTTAHLAQMRQVA